MICRRRANGENVCKRIGRTIPRFFHDITFKRAEKRVQQQKNYRFTMVNPFENRRQRLDLVPPLDHFLTKNWVLLETGRLPLRSGRALDVPIAQAELSERSKISASREKLAAEYSADQPACTSKRRRRFPCMVFGYQAACHVHSEHFL